MKILRSRRNNITLIIDTQGNLIIRAPFNTSRKLIAQFVNDKADWIEKNQLIALERKKETHQFNEGESFYYQGKSYPLIYRSNQVKPLVFDGAFYFRSDYRDHAQEIFTKWYQNEARILFSQRLALFSHQYRLTYTKLRISSARTRWGSCSSKKTISLTWRLVMAPLDVIDYVILHELVHLRHPNHSKVFWGELAKILPNYQKSRTWLKENGHQLTL